MKVNVEKNRNLQLLGAILLFNFCHKFFLETNLTERIGILLPNIPHLDNASPGKHLHQFGTYAVVLQN